MHRLALLLALPSIALAEPGDTGETHVDADCDTTGAFWIQGELEERSVRTDEIGHDLDRVRLTVRASDPECATAVTRVTYHLQPSEQIGDEEATGHPVELDAWGFFPAWAEVELDCGALLAVNGYVEWER